MVRLLKENVKSPNNKKLSKKKKEKEIPMQMQANPSFTMNSKMVKSDFKQKKNSKKLI